eukprot:CAMPEP_0178439070 /NCGR_PEP_ID=MMETSP0689_2-20121128/35951_1 /TAXON_ID=160604 /ORGANISM="Amphidinium massartii, Strain CS-259" /LENGTH=314 /DNA_ID=CAMNT_0020061557 /DNA_START=62 /DNA_END=1006 /DNA_ORIENTATION=-
MRVLEEHAISSDRSSDPSPHPCSVPMPASLLMERPRLDVSDDGGVVMAMHPPRAGAVDSYHGGRRNDYGYGQKKLAPFAPWEGGQGGADFQPLLTRLQRLNAQSQLDASGLGVAAAALWPHLGVDQVAITAARPPDAGTSGSQGTSSQQQQADPPWSNSSDRTPFQEAPQRHTHEQAVEQPHVSQSQESPKSMMVRNLPLTLAQEDLIKALDDTGFAGSYDFCYLPRNFHLGVSHGYAFVNFTSDEAVDSFFSKWNGSHLFCSDIHTTAVNVTPAHTQGLSELLELCNKKKVQRVRNPKYRPFVRTQRTMSLQL